MNTEVLVERTTGTEDEPEVIDLPGVSEVRERDIVRLLNRPPVGEHGSVGTVIMNRGLHPLLDAIEWKGCPLCGESPTMIQVNGPDEIVLEGCGTVIDAKAWADERYRTASPGDADG